MCLEIKSPFDFNNMAELAAHFKDEKTCLDYIEQWRWEGDIRCPHCGYNKIYRLKSGKKFNCANCKECFTITSGTIFDSTKLPLVKWMMALYFVSASKKGVSSCQLAQHLGVTQKTSWYMLQKIRSMLDQSGVKLEGIVSSDESFCGGKNKNRHFRQRRKYTPGRNFPDKTPVLGMMEKDGRVKTIVLPSIANKHIHMHVLSSVKHGSVLVTDEYAAYKNIGRHYDHQVVSHRIGEYTNYNGYSSNNIEGFWSHLKRMIIGVYHWISPKYLQRYCDELTFRFNARKEKQSVRFAMLFDKLRIKITHKQLVYG